MLIVALSANSCNATKEVTRSETVVVTERDTLIITMVDSSSILAYLECDSMGRVMMYEVGKLNDSLSQKRVRAPTTKIEGKGKRNARVNVSLKDHTLSAECECDTLEILAKVRNSEVIKYKIEYRERKRTKTENFLLYCGVLFWMLIVILIWINKKS